MTNSAAGFGGAGDGGFLNLNGIGSTFSAPGTYNSGTGEFDGNANNPVPVFVTGGTLQVTDLGGGFTELTVVPEPTAFSLTVLSLLGLAAVRRRRNHRS